MNDLIDRQAAIDALRTCQTYLFHTYDPDKKISLESAEFEIEQLPPVQPEPLTLRVNSELTKEEYDKLMQDIKDAPVVLLPSAQPQQWIPCSERLPEEYGEYRITWTTSYFPSKRLIGDSEYEVTSVWDEERNTFKGEWLLADYIQAYPDVKVIAWKPLEEPYKGEQG